MHQLLFAMVAHAALCFALYVVLFTARSRAIRRRVDQRSTYELSDSADPFAMRASANLRNQYEMPVLFHVAALVLIILQAASGLAVILAWTFVLGRVAHSAVHVFVGKLAPRALAFLIGFIACAGLWVLVAQEAMAVAAVYDAAR